MKVKEYIVGHRIDLESSLALADVERAIRDGIKSGFNPFYTGVVGWTRFKRVRLRWATAMWGNGFQPIFSGRLEAHLGGTRLKARFGAPVYLLVFFAVWYFLLTSFVITAVTAYVTQSYKLVDMLVALPASLGMMAIPVVFHLIFNRNADEHFEQIVTLLGEVAQLNTQAFPSSR